MWCCPLPDNTAPKCITFSRHLLCLSFTIFNVMKHRLATDCGVQMPDSVKGIILECPCTYPVTFHFGYVLVVQLRIVYFHTREIPPVNDETMDVMSCSQQTTSHIPHIEAINRLENYFDCTQTAEKLVELSQFVLCYHIN